MTKMPHITRRQFAAFAAASLALPQMARAKPALEITWDDLIPPGVPYSEIIGMGEMDEASDTWNPEFDENGVKLNTELDGRLIKMPGYVLPLDPSATGLIEFVLVPYVGACLHVPPPPPNQLVFVTADEPYQLENLWDPVWVTGVLSATPQSTAVAEVGYQLAADEIVLYEW